MFEARYPGQCNAECGEPIEVGELCMYDPGEADKVIHERCALGLDFRRGLNAKSAEKPHKFEGTTLDEMGY